LSDIEETRKLIKTLLPKLYDWKDYRYKRIWRVY
jgi:hypothetical protein